ncbi:MAG: hypothetical protein ACFE9T_10630 [Promethearchaeota archaeon]
MNSNLIEKKVEDLLEKILKPEESQTKRNIQRIKFRLISKLVADLFDHKNSKDCFHNISNLIILVLSIYNDTYPIDSFSDEKMDLEEKPTTKHENILKQEFLAK